jgi:hypothetical protein
MPPTVTPSGSSPDDPQAQTEHRDTAGAASESEASLSSDVDTATIETRLGIVPILAMVRTAAPEAASAPEEIARRTNEFLGDGHLKAGHIVDARKAYEAAGSKNKLVDLGDRCLQQELFDDARKAYEAAGFEIPVDKFIALGDRSLRETWRDDNYHVDENLARAGRAYKAAGSVGRLIALVSCHALIRG